MYRDEALFEVERLNNIINKAKKLINFSHNLNPDSDDVDYIAPEIYEDLLSILEGNDEVEITEEDNKIERLQWCNIEGDSTKAQLLELRENVILQFDKINEIIDYINRGN